MNKIKSLAGETALYGLGSIVPRMLNFFLVSLHTRIFLPAEYSISVSLYAWVAVLNIIYLFGMETTYFRFSTKEGSDEQRVFRVAQTFVLAISFSISLLIILFAGPIAGYFDIPVHNDFIVWLAAIMFVDAAVAIPFARLRLKKKAALFAFAKITNIVILIGLNFYFLTWAYDPTTGIGYVFLANLFANLFYLIFFLKTLVTWRPAMDRLLFASMFTYAFPIMLTGLPGMLNEMFSRMALESWLPENFYPGKDAAYALGVFGACFRFSVIMNLAVQAFRFAAEPFFFSNASDKNSPQLFAKVNHFFTILCCFILLAVVINMDLLRHLVSENYWEGLSIVPILLAAYMFLGVYYNMSVWFKLTDRTYFGTIITTGGALLTILLNYILIPQYGYMGSSWATLLCYFSMTAACYFLGRKFLPIPYKILEGLAYLFFALLLIQISALAELSSPYLSLGFHLVILLIFLLSAYLRERKYWTSAVG